MARLVECLLLLAKRGHTHVTTVDWRPCRLTIEDALQLAELEADRNEDFRLDGLSVGPINALGAPTTVWVAVPVAAAPTRTVWEHLLEDDGSLDGEGQP